tara:strand:+ start:546 stop:1076 length:531 start_codon:yes stop_codon:yes gene_type:complete
MATNLEFIKSTECTSAVATLSVTDCFSDKYEKYRVVLKVDEVSAEAATEIRLLDSSSNALATNHYQTAHRFMADNGSFSNGGGSGYQDQAKWQYTMYNEGSVGGFSVYEIFSPYSNTQYTYMSYQMTSNYDSSGSSRSIARAGIGVYNQTTRVTGIQAHQPQTRLTKAKLIVYGIS